jgi:hypothetical protein
MGTPGKCVGRERSAKIKASSSETMTTSNFSPVNFLLNTSKRPSMTGTMLLQTSQEENLDHGSHENKIGIPG